MARADSHYEKHILCPLSKCDLDVARGVWGPQEGGPCAPPPIGRPLTKSVLLIRAHRAEREPGCATFSGGFAVNVGTRGRVRGNTAAWPVSEKRRSPPSAAAEQAPVGMCTSFCCVIRPELKLILPSSTGLPL